MCKKKRKWARLAICSLFLGGVALGALLLGAQPASAVDNGPTVTGQVCMQTTFSGQVFGQAVPNSDKLNCTAQDIKIAAATTVSPTSCIAGDTFDLTATFRVDVTANSRYDAGFYFNIDGGANARLGTECSLSVVTPGASTSLNLDQDFCGDFNAGTHFVTFTIPDVLCQAQPGTNVLRLPNCTAWHSNSGTACTQNTDADPDTKSKCNCDDNFTVPVTVEDATLLVTKTASPTSVSEAGGTVTYTVQVTNQSSFVDVIITSIKDCIAFDTQGNCSDEVDLTGIPLCAPGQPAPSTGCTPDGATSCLSLKGQTLQENGGSLSCSFQAFVSGGDTGGTIRDVVEVCGTQQGTGATVCDDDDAEVTITDVASTPSLAKTAQSASCTVDVTYQVVVTNNSAIDTLTMNSLSDDKFGNITTSHVAGGGFEEVVSTTCGQATPNGAGVLPATIAKSGNYTCSFVGRIETGTGACAFTHANTVTGNVTDDDGVTSTPSDGASVTVSTTLQ